MRVKLFLVFLCLQVGLLAQNVLIVNDHDVFYGDTAWVEIEMENNDEILAFQFDLIYPENLVYSGTAFLSDRSNEHTLNVQFNVDYLRVMAYNLNMDPFSGNSGVLVTVGLVPADIYDTFDIEISNPNLTDENFDNVITDWINGQVTVHDSHPYLSDFEPASINEDTELIISPEFLSDHVVDLNTPFQELIWSFSADQFTFFPQGGGFVATPEVDWFGLDTIRVIVNDDLFADTTWWSVNILPVNDSPVQVSPLPDVQLNEDETTMLDLSVYFDDIDSELSYQVIQSPPEITTVFDLSVLEIIPMLNWNGNSQLTIQISDGIENISAVLSFNVIPVNDAPVLFEIGPQVTSEDSPLNIPLLADDVEGDNLIFIGESDNTGVSPNIVNGYLILTPVFNWFGNANITVSVTDGQYWDDEIFSLTVVSVNDPPIINTPATITFDEDGSLVVDFLEYIIDYDGDPFDFDITGNDNIAIEMENFLVTFIASENWNGIEDLIVSANDNQGGPDITNNLAVVVLPINDPPVMEQITDQTIDEDSNLLLTLSASDIDGDNLEFEIWEQGSFDFTLDGIQLNLVPIPNMFGEEQITVAVSDNQESDFTQFFVTVNPVNDPPFLTMSSYSDTISLATESVIDLEANDIDSEILTFGVYDEPYWIYSIDNEIFITPPDEGIFHFGIFVTDGEYYDNTIFEITVGEFRAIITSIDDVPDDQGGWVYVQFDRSFYDTDSAERDIEIYHLERLDGENWVSIGSSSAYASESYTILGPTLQDSVPGDPGEQAFRIVASMDEGTFISEVEFGYSIDNIAPEIPQGLTAGFTDGIIAAQWEMSEAEDFQFYRVYVGGELVETTMETGFYYIVENLIENILLEVSAVDIHNNESELATFNVELMTADILDFNQNWNLISFDIELENNSTEDVFSDLINEESLIYVTGFNQYGSNFYDPNGWEVLNNLITIEKGFGYWVKVNEDESLVQSGYPIYSTHSIDVLSGWNIIGYWNGDPMFPEEAFAELIDQENLVYVTGFLEGGATFFDPNGEPYMNTLSALMNGSGYAMKVQEAVEGFQYPTPSGVAAKQMALNTNPEIVKTNLFMFVNGQADFQFLDFEVGSKINVYTQNELLVGEMEILENGVLRTGAVYGDDKTTQVLDGAIESEKLIFRYNDIESVPVNIQFTGNMELQKVDLIFKNVPTEFSLDQNFPNPFNPITTIRYGLPEQSQITISIVDILGRGIRELVNEEKPAGYHTTIWDGKDEMGMDVSSGVYFYTLNGVGFSKTQKMVLLR